MAFKTSVDEKKCRGCEICVDHCTASVFTMQKRKAVVINPRACLGCQLCVDNCKEKAITVTELRPSLSETCRLLLANLPEN